MRGAQRRASIVARAVSLGIVLAVATALSACTANHTPSTANHTPSTQPKPQVSAPEKHNGVGARGPDLLSADELNSAVRASDAVWGTMTGYCQTEDVQGTACIFMTKDEADPAQSKPVLSEFQASCGAMMIPADADDHGDDAAVPGGRFWTVQNIATLVWKAPDAFAVSDVPKGASILCAVSAMPESADGADPTITKALIDQLAPDIALRASKWTK